MLSLPDFKEKKILFVFGDKDMENKLKFWNDNIRLFKDGKPVNQLSCHKILAVFIYGECSLTSVLIRNCMKYGISLILTRNNFEVYANMGLGAEGNTLLRQRQYSMENNFELAKNLIKNKIHNQFMLLSRAKKIKTPIKHYKISAQKIDTATDAKQLLGIEGNHTKSYFQTYFKEVGWYRRMPRAKVDEINVLMDIGYTLLLNFMDSILRLYGFDVYKGFYHTLFFQRKSLACDMIEPFRCLIDASIVKMFNLKQLDPKDFKKKKGKDKVFLPYQKQGKYLKIFTETLMDHKEAIFDYTRTFYYSLINEKEGFPFFKLSN